MKNIWNFHAKMHLRIKGAFFVFPVSFFLSGLQPLVRKKCIKHRAISSDKLAIPVCYGLFRIIPVESAQFQSNRPNSGRIGLVPAYSGLFQLIDSRLHMVKLAKGFILLLSSACLCSCSSGVCLGGPLVCGVCLGSSLVCGLR